MTQLPAALIARVDPARVQGPDVREKVTGRPELAVALNGIGGFPTVCARIEGNVIVCAAGLTVMAGEVPVMATVTVSVAVSVCEPDVFNVAENVPAPAVRVPLPGRTASPSLLVK